MAANDGDEVKMKEDEETKQEKKEMDMDEGGDGNDKEKDVNKKRKRTKAKSSSLWNGSTASVIHPTHMYLKLCVEQFTQSKSTIPLKHEMIQRAVSEALCRMYGNFGSGRLHYVFVDQYGVDGIVVLHTPVACYKRIWAALTAFANFNGHRLRFTVTGATPFLCALDQQRDDEPEVNY